MKNWKKWLAVVGVALGAGGVGWFVSPASACVRFDARCKSANDSGNFMIGFVCGLHYAKFNGERDPVKCARGLETLDGAASGAWRQSRKK